MATYDPSGPVPAVVALIAQPIGIGTDRVLVIPESGVGGVPLSRISQPQNEGNSTVREPSADDWAEASFGTLTNKVGLFVSNVPYVRSGTSVLQNTGGELDATVTYGAAVIGPDTRAFMYGQDVATLTQAVPILATAAGEQKVSTSGATIPSTADFTTVAATKSSILAINLARHQAIIQNLDATDSVRVGDTSIGAARGLLVIAGASITLATTAEIFVFPVAGTPIVSINEIAS